MPEGTKEQWTDREIRCRTDDRLGFEHYCDVLAAIVLQYDTPLTIGISGPWGSGKTSLMRLVEEKLQGERTPRHEKVLPIWFNAWTYDRQEVLWRALVLRVLSAFRPRNKKDKLKTQDQLTAVEVALVHDLDDLEASLYRDVDREVLGGVKLDAGKLIRGASKGLLDMTLTLVPGVGAPLAKLIEKAAENVTGEDLGSLLDAVQRERHNIHRDRLQSLEQFQDKFTKLIEQQAVRKNKRLVVFVDDLDRCLPENAIEVLEALKLFLDVPGCVFFLAADRDVIEKGIRVKYRSFLVEPDTSDESPEEQARRIPITGDNYLEKIVQVPFQLLPLRTEHIEGFVATCGKGIADDNCVKVFAEGLEPNPRKVKRTLNIFRMLSRLAVVKGMTEINRALLAKVVVIQSRWRDLYSDLVEYPNLIQDLERHARTGETSDQPEPHTPETAQRSEEASVSQEQVATSKAQGVEDSRTLLSKYAGRRDLRDMLRLPPWFGPLKLDQIRDYLYLTHMAAERPAAVEAEDIDAKRWDDLLSGDGTKISKALAEIQDDRSQAAYVPRLLRVLASGEKHTAQQRVSTGLALGRLGDPRPDVNCDSPDTLEIPAGAFLMGSKPGNKLASEDEFPQRSVELPAYRIGRYPVTMGQYQRFVEDGGYSKKRRACWSDEGWEWRELVKVTSPEYWDDKRFNVLNHPVVGVSWYEAEAYCAWLRETSDRPFRLPSEAEWEKAARGTDGKEWPWGDEFSAEKANTMEGRIGGTSAVGCYPGGASPYGCLDMAGNVWQWTADWFGPYPGSTFKSEAFGEKYRVVRGGSWNDDQFIARCAIRLRNIPDFRLIYVGFRVAE